MRRLAVAIAALAVAWASGCESDRTIAITLVRVSPPADASCGAPADARTLIVTALGEHPPSGATAFAPDLGQGGTLALPVSTRVVAVEVLGAAGALRAVGRTAPFSVDALEPGAELPIATAPPRGFCPVGPPGFARVAPLAAPAAGGVLIAGGRDAEDEPVAAVEWYDPSRGVFDDLGAPLYTGSHAGLEGATMTLLDDGRVVVAGGGQPAYQIFDAETRHFGSALLLGEARAHHAATALAGGRLLLAGGCAELGADGACADGSLLSSSTILEVDGGALSPGPELSAPRVGGVAIREPDGRVLLLGGTDADGDAHLGAERLDLDAGTSETVAGAAAAVASSLASGSVLAVSASGDVVVLPPGASSAAAIGELNAFDGTATATEDGRVLLLGGGASYLLAPGTGRLVDLGEATGAELAADRTEHAAVMLPDGAVLVVGGANAAGDPRTDAFVFRPDLTGPYTSGAAIAFSTRELAEQVIPRDPGMAEILAASGDAPAHAWIEASGGGDEASEWIVVAGPRFTAPKLEMRLGADGGAAVLVGFRDPARRWEVRLREGEAAELWQIDEGEAIRARGCSAAAVPAGALGDGGRSAPVAVDVSGAGLSAHAGGAEVLACPDVREVPFGLVGVGPLGPEGSGLRVDSILVER